MERLGWIMFAIPIISLAGLMAGAVIAWLHSWLRRQLDEPDEHRDAGV